MSNSKQPKQLVMGKGHRYQRSSSGAQFGSHNSSYRKRNFAPRNPPTPLPAQSDMGSFEGGPESRFVFSPPPPPPPLTFWGCHPRHSHSRPIGNFGSPPLRPFDTIPPAMPYGFSHPLPFYHPMPYLMDRGFGGPLRRPAEQGYQDFQNRLFRDDYRFPGPHQAYQPPNIEACIQAPPEQGWKGENPEELVAKSLAQGNRLRGDAPEFVPLEKYAIGKESRSKVKEPCWLVVSST